MRKTTTQQWLDQRREAGDELVAGAGQQRLVKGQIGAGSISGACGPVAAMSASALLHVGDRLAGAARGDDGRGVRLDDAAHLEQVADEGGVGEVGDLPDQHVDVEPAPFAARPHDRAVARLRQRPAPCRQATFTASCTDSARDRQLSGEFDRDRGEAVPGSRPPETMRRPMISAARTSGRAPRIDGEQVLHSPPLWPVVSAGVPVSSQGAVN